ncbi:MAG TPA: flagellar assembly protein FliH [Bacillales bacterium]|nr:flagellar assembly protein FliH [Bacillales bacterium]
MIKSGKGKDPDVYADRRRIQLSPLLFEQEAQYGEEAAPNPVPILKKAEIEANNIRRQAQAEAEQIRREIDSERKSAKKELEEAFESAKKQGYQQGYHAGAKEGEKQFRDRINEACAIVTATKKARRERLEETERDMIDLAVRVAEKIVGTVLSEDRDRWADMVKQAITEVKEYEEIRLIVHHKWYEYIVSRKRELQAVLKKTAELYIYPEATGDEQTCIIEFPFGRIDASVDSQLSEIKGKLAAKLEESGDEPGQPD